MRFDIKVLDREQELRVLTLEADSREEAAKQARDSGGIVLSIKTHALGIQSRLPSGRSVFPLVLFSQELLSLLDAGLSLVESIETLREKEHRPKAKRVLDEVMEALNEGLPLSSAFEKSGVFPALYIALIRSSEKTGNLVDALSRFVEYQSQVDLARKKVVSASIYPALLILVGGLVVAFLMFYVVPRFSTIYEGSRANLPWLSVLLLQWGALLQKHTVEAALGIVVILGAAVFGFSRNQVRRYLIGKFWRTTTLGERLKIYQLARFYRTLGMLLRGGIPALTALGMVEGLLDQGLGNKLKIAMTAIREGQAISHAMEANGLTTPVAVRMLRVGERSGKMGEMMERIGHFYDDEIARWIDWFTRMFEPVLMTGIGLIIGVIVLMMYMPIFELAGSIQ